jgi:hypothetical protein
MVDISRSVQSGFFQPARTGVKQDVVRNGANSISLNLQGQEDLVALLGQPS